MTTITSRANSPFSVEQETWIVSKFFKLENITQVRRQFGTFIKITPKKLLHKMQFKRVVDRNKGIRSVITKAGCSPTTWKCTEDNKQLIKAMLEENPSTSIRQITKELELSVGTVWKIMRKELKLYPYKPKNVVPLTKAHKQGRLEFRHWLLEQPDEFPNQVIWSDEKLWEEKVRPNKQNERYWGLCDPEVEDENRVQGGKKIMSWGGLINGKVILHWFDFGDNINQQLNLNMLRTVLWPKVQSVATRKRLWFQQDGATCHTTLLIRGWLSDKFGERIISRLSARPWPGQPQALVSLPGLCVSQSSGGTSPPHWMS